MTVDTTAVSDDKKTNLPITQRDRRDVIRQVREITGFDENSINQTIEACKDSTGSYSLEQVISLLLDDNLRQTNPHKDPTTLTPSQSQPKATNKIPATGVAGKLPPISTDFQPNDSISDDVTDFVQELDDQTSQDDDLARAILLSRETMGQMIDESDVAERKSYEEPVGLKNIGNTCWFNSVIQVLYSLPYFRRLILNFRFVSVNRILTEEEQQAIALTQELRSLFILMLKSLRRSINPDQAIKKFRNTRKLCGLDFSHEDCSEFATHLIDLIELAYETVGKNSSNSDGVLASHTTNPIHALVTGEVNIERHENRQIRESLRQINIQMIDSSNLYDGLEAVWLGSVDEALTNQQPIVEQRWLTNLPPVLFICLNRYRFSHATKQASKIISPFEFYQDLYLDRYMLMNKDLIVHKRNIARKLYARLHELEKLLNSYLKYPCNDESFALANAIRVVYEYATGCRLNPTLPKTRTDSNSSEQTVSTRTRTHSTPSLQPSQISQQELHFIQNTLPTWLTEIEAKCSQLREEIKGLQNQLKQLYDEASLKRFRYTLHAVCVHEGSATLGHFWTYVYHLDRKKWFRYNDNEVVESQWDDVFEAGIGGQRPQNDRNEPRVPSAYLLVYINADQKSLWNNFQFEMTPDLQHVLDDDHQLWQQQIERYKVEKLYHRLKTDSELLIKSGPVDVVLTLPFFTGPNPTSDAELVKLFSDATISILKTNENRILSMDVHHLLHEIIDKEIKHYESTSTNIIATLPNQDLRLQHILAYFAANHVEPIYRKRVMLDIIRLLAIPNEEYRLKIFKYQAQISAQEMRMSTQTANEYHKLLVDYKDYRSVIAAFLAGCQLMNEDKFEDAITYFCVASEYNLRLTKQLTCPMKAMDSGILFQTRRLCFQRWHKVVVDRFKNDCRYRLDSMTNQFLPCLMQLKLSNEDDQAYITEIQSAWCLLLDKVEPPERLKSLEEFFQRLLEQPVGQHYHSVTINKTQLMERYEQTIRELYRQYPSFAVSRTHQQQEINRTVRPTGAVSSVSIPIVVHRTAALPSSHAHGSSAVQHENVEATGTASSSGSLPPSSS